MNNNLIFGINPIIEALNSDNISVDKIFILKNKKDKKISELINIAKKKNVKIRFYDKNFFAKFKNINHQGLIAEIVNFQYSPVEELFNNKFLIALDHITDVQNFGNIIRTAVFFGVDGIIIPKDRSVSVNDTVIKTSSGAIFHIKISKVTNLNNIIVELKNNNFKILGTSLAGNDNFENINPLDKICLVMGNEEKGIRKSLLKKCDFIIGIQGSGKFDSLNVSSACAIFIYELNKILRQK